MSGKHVDTTRTYRPRTWVMSDDPDPYTDLSGFFRGANHGHRVADRFDAFTWWAHSVQNTHHN